MVAPPASPKATMISGCCSRSIADLGLLPSRLSIKLAPPRRIHPLILRCSVVWRTPLPRLHGVACHRCDFGVDYVLILYQMRATLYPAVFCTVRNQKIHDGLSLFHRDCIMIHFMSSFLTVRRICQSTIFNIRTSSGIMV